MGSHIPLYDDVESAIDHYRQISYDHWVHDEFLTWKWWLLLALSVIPWFIWWKIADKRRAGEILLYGALIAIVNISLDVIGTDLLWWGYPDKLLQFAPPLLPADLTLVPCCMMLVYQFFHRPRPFFVAIVFAGLIMAFVGEPIFVLLEYYTLHRWHFVYSFFYYIVTGYVCRWIVIKMFEQPDGLIRGNENNRL